MIINLFNKETTDFFFYEMSYVQIDYCMSLLQKLTHRNTGNWNMLLKDTGLFGQSIWQWLSLIVFLLLLLLVWEYLYCICYNIEPLVTALTLVVNSTACFIKLGVVDKLRHIVFHLEMLVESIFCERIFLYECFIYTLLLGASQHHTVTEFSLSYLLLQPKLRMTLKCWYW